MQLSDALRVAASVARLQRSQWHRTGRIRADQQARLGRLLAHASRRVPYYRHLGIDTPRGEPAEWLTRFPVLTRRDVQTAGDALLAEGTAGRQLHCSRTSGSTGEPTLTYFDRSTWLFAKYALKLRRMLNCGLGPGARVLIVSEADADALGAARKDMLPGQGWLFHQVYVSLHAPLADHVRELQRLRPQAVYGFPSYFSDLLDHYERHGIRPAPAKVVFTSSEVLPPALRRRLAAAFAARVCDVYGCTEFKEIAWQCEAGCYHVNHESVWIEVEADATADGAGALLLTTLINRAAPLIRYRVGDLGRLGWVRCDCGREGPALCAVAGREVELLELPDGRRLSPYLLTTAVEDLPGLRQYQFVQTAPDQLELRYTALDGRQPDPGALHRRLDTLLGRHVRIRLRSVAAIPRTPGGKRQVLVRAPAAGGNAERP